uniref:Uncharacterized protein n=1 Tax=Ditylenchus dipsaci TaxID=166011 RepID=A0A915E6Z6_9BILA
MTLPTFKRKKKTPAARNAVPVVAEPSTGRKTYALWTLEHQKALYECAEKNELELYFLDWLPSRKYQSVQMRLKNLQNTARLRGAEPKFHNPVKPYPRTEVQASFLRQTCLCLHVRIEEFAHFTNSAKIKIKIKMPPKSFPCKLFHWPNGEDGARVMAVINTDDATVSVTGGMLSPTSLVNLVFKRVYSGVKLSSAITQGYIGGLMFDRKTITRRVQEDGVGAIDHDPENLCSSEEMAKRFIQAI